MGGATKKHIVLVVHGTFSDARAFRRSAEGLLSELRTHSFELRHFAWSGSNTLGARIRAANRLRNKLYRLLQTHQDENVSIVAHSHGGNVVIDALCRKPDMIDAVHRVILLATPFLFVSRRKNSEFVSNCVAVLKVIAAVGVSALIIRGGFIATYAILRLFHLNEIARVLNEASHNENRAQQLALLAIVVGMGLGLTLAVARVWHRLGHVVDSGARRVEQFAVPSGWLKERTLLIRAPGDEASGLLVASQFASWLLNRVGLLIAVLSESLVAYTRNVVNHRRFRSLLAVTLTAGIGSTLASIFLDVGNDLSAELAVAFNNLVWGVEVLVGGIGLMTALVYVAIGLPASLLLLSFGFDLAGVGYLLQVTCESAPAGEWRALILSPVEPSRLGLSHSVYNHPKVGAVIISWLSDALAEQ